MKTAKGAQASRMTAEDSQASNGAIISIQDIGIDCHFVFQRPNASHQRRMEGDEAKKDTNGAHQLRRNRICCNRLRERLKLEKPRNDPTRSNDDVMA
jgi:hypothetical protein